MEAEEEKHVCPFCNKNISNNEDVQKLKSKGATTLVNEGFSVHVGQLVHQNCRRIYSRNKHRLPKLDDQQVPQSSSRSLRNHEDELDFNRMCFLCGTTLDRNDKEALLLLTFDAQFRIKEISQTRNDEWGNIVNNRISHVIDLPAANAMYHQPCNVNFRTSRNIPLKYSPETNDEEERRNTLFFFYKKPRDLFGTQSFLKISQSSSQNFLRVS